MEALKNAVKNSTDEAVAMVEQLDNACLLVEPGTTLFDLAISADNQAVIEHLANRPDACAFTAPIEDDYQAGLNFHLTETGVEQPVDRTEAHLANVFGPQLHFARTPLHTACRVGNRFAMEVLLRAGAKVTEKDRLKLTAPDLSFYAHGESGLSEFLDAFEASGQKPFAASATLVRELLAYPALLERLRRCARFGAAVNKLLLCYDCARLDVEAVKRTLAGKFDVNKAITRRLHPVYEACTSHLFWSDRLPGHGYYAFHLTKHVGPAGSHAVQIDNDLIEPDGSNLDRLMREAERTRQALVQEGMRLSLSDADAAEQLDKRCAIIDALVEAGLEIEKASKLLDEDFFDELDAMGLGPLARHLETFGFNRSAAVDTGNTMGMQTSWELPAETLLEARVENRGGEWLLEFVLTNGYGPLDNVRLDLRFGDGQGEHGDWLTAECWAETLDTDEGVRPRGHVAEPISEEMRWTARYRAGPFTHPLPIAVAVRLNGPEPLNNADLDDWVLY